MNLKKFTKFNESITLSNIDEMKIDTPEDMFNLMMLSKKLKNKLEASRKEFLVKERQEVDDRLLAFSEKYDILSRVGVGPSSCEQYYIACTINYGHIVLNESPNFIEDLLSTLIKIYDRYKFILIRFDSEYGNTPKRLEIPIDNRDTYDNNVNQITKYITNTNSNGLTIVDNNYQVRINLLFEI